MRTIDANALKKTFDLIASKSETGDWQFIPIKHIKQIIDNAPTVNKCDSCNLMCRPGVKIEVIEHHTFATPDDVSDIKFGE